MSDETIWISRDVVESVAAEASARAPFETGGVLLGYWAKDDGGTVVTHSIGPGSNAVHSETRFRPDHDYHLTEIARLYEESNRRLHYLGDWHSHPDGEGTLSRLDRSCLRRISRCSEARVERPVMLILAGTYDWKPFVWRFESVRRWLWWQGVSRSLTLRVFDGDGVSNGGRIDGRLK